MKFSSARKGRMKMLKQKHIFAQAQKKKWSKFARCARIAFSAKDTQTKKSSKKFTLSSTVFSKEGVCFSLHIFVFCTSASTVNVRHFCSATCCSQTAWMVHQRRQQNCISMCQLFRLFRVTAITISWTVPKNVRRIHDLFNCLTGSGSDRRV